MSYSSIQPARSFRAAATVAASAAPARAASVSLQSNNQVQFASIGVGSRGTDCCALRSRLDSGRCAAICDTYRPHLERAIATAGNDPKGYLNHRSC